jgi:hypothetical protein
MNIFFSAVLLTTLTTFVINGLTQYPWHELVVFYVPNRLCN